MAGVMGERGSAEHQEGQDNPHRRAPAFKLLAGVTVSLYFCRCGSLEIQSLRERRRSAYSAHMRGERGTEAPRHLEKNEPDCVPDHICSVWRLLSSYRWGFQGPSDLFVRKIARCGYVPYALPHSLLKLAPMRHCFAVGTTYRMRGEKC
jgi:hypothetical protein